MDDPLSLLAFAVWTLAAGMYPLGFMFGTCSACCDTCRSDTCEGFDLEEAFSCRSGGNPLCFRSADLLSLQFTSPCFGTGAAGTVQGTGADTPSSPGVTPGRGPLTGVTLTNGGSGYAILGRRAPTITLVSQPTVGGSGYAIPATVTVNLENVKDNCNIDTWQIESLTIIDGGRGYQTYQPLDFAIESGGVVLAHATGLIAIRNSEPTLTATASPGTGATFTVLLAENEAGWTVVSVEVSGNTSGYVDGTLLTFASEDATPDSTPAEAYIRTTGENGQISSIDIGYGGLYYVAGVFDGVDVFTDRGSFYYPDASLPAYVRPPNVTVIQGGGPSPGFFGTDRGGGGSGAQITATVDGNPASPTFGRVTGLTLVNAGTNYLAYYKDAIEYLGNGKFALGTALSNPQPGNFDNSAEIMIGYRAVPKKGCWVSGDGIAFGTQVTELSNEILNMGVYQPPVGCCRYTYTATSAITGAVLGNGASQFVSELTQQQCEDAFNNPSHPNIGAIISNKRDYSWGPQCIDCGGNPIRSRGFVTERTWSGRWIVTVDPPPVATPTGCVKFCGSSGLCGPMPRHPNAGDLGVGPFGADTANNYGGVGSYNMRRMCLRWVCRCYEGTGKKGQPAFTDPYDWYTVESTTEVGGPVVFGGTLTEKLEAATSNYYGYEKLEHDILFGDPNEWQAEEGDRFCMIWRFVFYGTTAKAIQDRCNFPDDEAEPSTTTAKDVYTISYCDRCSCQ